MKFKDFIKLNDKDKSVNYTKLSSHDKFLARLNAPINAISHGFNSEMLTKEQKEILEKLENYSNKLLKDVK